MGFSDEDLKDFFCGPSYFSWFWMGNLDGWGGPLPKHWMTSHFELQKKIISRERALGMKPILPAFTGHVPASFKKKFPNANFNWSNLGEAYISLTNSNKQKKKASNEQYTENLIIEISSKTGDYFCESIKSLLLWQV